MIPAPLHMFRDNPSHCLRAIEVARLAIRTHEVIAEVVAHVALEPFVHGHPKAHLGPVQDLGGRIPSMALRRAYFLTRPRTRHRSGRRLTKSASSRSMNGIRASIDAAIVIRPPRSSRLSGVGYLFPAGITAGRLAAQSCLYARRSPRGARTSLSYRQPPPAAAIHEGNEHAGGQGPGSVQETDTRARSGGTRHGVPAPFFYYGLERSRQLRRRPPARHRNCAPPDPPASTRSRVEPRPPTAGNTPAAQGTQLSSHHG